MQAHAQWSGPGLVAGYGAKCGHRGREECSGCHCALRQLQGLAMGNAQLMTGLVTALEADSV